MKYKLLFSSKSNKQIKKFSKDLKKRISKACDEIEENPFHKGTIKIEGYDNIRRKRVGRYRILYTIDEQLKEILIIKIEKRDENTYKGIIQ